MNNISVYDGEGSGRCCADRKIDAVVSIESFQRGDAADGDAAHIH